MSDDPRDDDATTGDLPGPELDGDEGFEDPLIAEPGTQISYSGPGLAAAGLGAGAAGLAPGVGAADGFGWATRDTTITVQGVGTMGGGAAAAAVASRQPNRRPTATPTATVCR